MSDKHLILKKSVGSGRSGTDATAHLVASRLWLCVNFKSVIKCVKIILYVIISPIIVIIFIWALILTLFLIFLGWIDKRIFGYDDDDYIGGGSGTGSAFC